MTTLRVIRGAVSRGEAEAVARQACRGPTAWVERELFYPYHYFLLRVSWRTLLGRDGARLPGLVDARTRVVSTSDPLTLEDVPVEPSGALPARVEEAEAERLARRAASLLLGRRQRAFSAPAWEVLERGLVHKRFWVVRAAEQKARRFLVDGVTGGIFPLDG